MDEDEIIASLERRLKRATDLLRRWRDKYDREEMHTFTGVYGSKAASPTDLIRDTQRLLEGR